MANSGVVVGLEEVLAGLKDFGQKGAEKMEDILEAASLEITAEAKTKAPFDTGKLRQSIAHAKVAPLHFKNYINAGVAPYAPFVEFGTGTTVDVPAGWEDFARQYIGKGIKKINLPPRPFFTTAVEKARREIPGQVEAAIQQLTNENAR